MGSFSTKMYVSFLLFSIPLGVGASFSNRIRSILNIGKHHKLKQCRHGLFYFNSLDTYIGKSLDLYGEWSDEEFQLFSKFIQPGQIVLDVGANIGAFTIPFANQVGPTGIVHAFEPQRQLSQMISTNVALNQLPNVHVHNVAVGNQFGGSIQVPKLDYSKSANFGAISIHPNEMDWTKQGDTESVPVMTLDSKFYVPGSICPSFLKIDAEGMELMVLQGSQQLIAECLPVHCHWDVHPYFSSQNYAGETTSVFSEYAYSINVLCYPKDKEVSHIEELQDITRIDFENQKLLLSEYGLSFAGSTNVVGQLGNEMECIR